MMNIKIDMFGDYLDPFGEKVDKLEQVQQWLDELKEAKE